MRLTIGTRGSALALWQARHVAGRIEQANPGTTVELTIIKTRGDKILDTPLAMIGGKGLFTKEIEDALLDGRVDLAVHSLKDLPTELPEGLKPAAVMKREDPRDALVSRDGKEFHEMAPGSRIGTSSLRRKAFLLSRYPTLEVIPIRGNVDTRLRKIETEGLAGVVLAAAGIKRMGFQDRITTLLDTDFMVPAIGQGALAIETRRDDPAVDELIAPLNDPETADCVGIERAFLKRMGGGCQVPMAAHCVRDGIGIKVAAAVVHPDGTPIIRNSYSGQLQTAALGARLADEMIAEGADSILRAIIKDWMPGAVEEDLSTQEV